MLDFVGSKEDGPPRHARVRLVSGRPHHVGTIVVCPVKHQAAHDLDTPRLSALSITRGEQEQLGRGVACRSPAIRLFESTGQVSHLVGPDIDTERDPLIRDLRDASGGADIP